MKRNKSKARELKETEKYYRIDYHSSIDGEAYWHKAIGRNEIEAIADFKEAIDERHVIMLSNPVLI